MREFLWRISPLTNAASIEAPLFIAQGQNDPRVPVSEAEQIFQTVAENVEEKMWYMVADNDWRAADSLPPLLLCDDHSAVTRLLNDRPWLPEF